MKNFILCNYPEIFGLIVIGAIMCLVCSYVAIDISVNARANDYLNSTFIEYKSVRCSSQRFAHKGYIPCVVILKHGTTDMIECPKSLFSGSCRPFLKE